MVDKNAELEENEDLLNLEGYKENPTKIQNLNYKIPRKSYLSRNDKIFIMCQASRFL